jgi:hypothetical protein
LPGTQGLGALDALVSRVNAEKWVELPSAEKYCVLIRRACLNMVGFFDIERFGRGSGEAIDFSRRASAVGWHHALAADVFVHHSLGLPPNPEQVEAINDAEHMLSVLYPDYGGEVRDFIHQDPPAGLRTRINQARAALGGAGFAAVMDEQEQMRSMRTGASANAPPDAPLPVVLHITHDKATSRRWIRDYCAADVGCRSLVLRGRSSRNAATAELSLFDPRHGPMPLMTWALANPIRSVATAHAEVMGIVKWICSAFEVRAVLVSSLIGQTLDVLRLDLPTVWVAHDLFPFCPALTATFGTPCGHCDDGALSRCLNENPYNAFWSLAEVSEWQAMRADFARCLAAGHVRVVMPDEGLHARWETLFPDMHKCGWTCIPYGLGAAFTRGPVIPHPDFSEEAVKAAQTGMPPPRLRVLVPGRLLPHTGLGLWRAICDELRAFANVLLLDCGDFGQPFSDYTGVEVFPECDPRDWPEKIAEWNPDCALLLSSQPESFCYALAEMQALAIPVVAIRTDSSAGRIDSGWNGFLVEPETDAVLDILRALDRARDRLVTVTDILRFSPVRSAFDMVADVRRLLPELSGLELAPASGAGDGREVETLLAVLAKRQRAQEEILQLRDLLQAREEEERARAVNQRRLESMVEALAAQHAAVFHSLSWKMSAPIRAFERFRDRMRQKFSAPPVKPEVMRTRVERRKAPRPEPKVPVLLRSRASARYWLCTAIGAPDASVLIAGGGPDQSQRALQNFIGLADIVTRRSTRACFVWCGLLDNLRPDDRLILKLLREVGDLFVLDPQLDAEVFAGTDILLLPAETVGRIGIRGMVAGVTHVDLPLAPPDSGGGSVMAATVTQLLQYCSRADKTEPLLTT